MKCCCLCVVSYYDVSDTYEIHNSLFIPISPNWFDHQTTAWSHDRMMTLSPGPSRNLTNSNFGRDVKCLWWFCASALLLQVGRVGAKIWIWVTIACGGSVKSEYCFQSLLWLGDLMKFILQCFTNMSSSLNMLWTFSHSLCRAFNFTLEDIYWHSHARTRFQI